MLEIEHHSYSILRRCLYCVIALIPSVFTHEAVAQTSDDNLAQETSVYSAMSMGSGWALTKRHVVTNFHVIDGMQNLRLVTSDQREIAVNVVLVDKKNDLAVLSIVDEGVEIAPLPLALTKPRMGSQVFTIGYPHPDLMGTSPKLTSGFISATNGLADDPRTFQVSVPVQAGNSGGPLLNMRGEVVGVITSKLSAQKMFEWTGDIPQNVNYAIKVNRLSQLIGELETDEQVLAGSGRQNQNLESLAETIINSVIIVAGDGDKNNNMQQHVLFNGVQQSPAGGKEPKRTIIVYSYAQPGYYDFDDNIEGSNSVGKYSKNTVKLIKQQIVSQRGENIKFVTMGGKSIKEIFYRLEEKQYSKSLCEKNNASHILASFSEGRKGGQLHFRLVTYRIIDCETLNVFKKEYVIKRDEINDRFGFEVALHTTVKDFLIKTPPYINWEME